MMLDCGTLDKTRREASRMSGQTFVERFSSEQSFTVMTGSEREQRSRPSEGRNTPQLSCELCRERKIKCDKREPCTNCVQSDVACMPIFRHRLPRGRHAQRPCRSSSARQHTTAREHINATEPAVVDTTQPNRGRANKDFTEANTVGLAENHIAQPTFTDSRPPYPSPFMTPNLSLHELEDASQHPGPFWTQLVEEMYGINAVQETGTFGDGDKSGNTSASCRLNPGRYSTDGIHQPNKGVSLFCPFLFGPAVMARLCQVYFKEVDPMFKVLHKPTVAGFMVDGRRYHGFPDGHISTVALSAAVCYAAASSLTMENFQKTFEIDRSDVIREARKVCETALEKTDLFSTGDITILQAFVIYLVARRGEERSPALWTLIPLAVRLARALYLHQDLDHQGQQYDNFFAQQMRKRLWLSICVLDFQAALVQETEPLITPEEVASSLRYMRNVDDSDIGPNEDAVASKEELTDSTFALVTFCAQLTGRMLSFTIPGEQSKAAGNSNKDGIDSQDDSRRRRIQRHLQEFENKAFTLIRFCDPQSSSLAWFCWHGTQCLVASMRLAAVYPLRHISTRHPTNTSPGHDTSRVLHLALKVLETAQIMYTKPLSQCCWWYVNTLQHTLAIALNECNTCTDAALLHKAWPVIEQSYQLYECDRLRHGSEVYRGELAALMHRTRDELAYGKQITRVTRSNELITSAPDQAVTSDARASWSVSADNAAGLFWTPTSLPAFSDHNNLAINANLTYAGNTVPPQLESSSLTGNAVIDPNLASANPNLSLPPWTMSLYGHEMPVAALPPPLVGQESTDTNLELWGGLGSINCTSGPTAATDFAVEDSAGRGW